MDLARCAWYVPVVIQSVLPSADTDPCSHIGEVLIVGTSGAGSLVGAKASLLVLTYITMWTQTMDLLFDTQLCAFRRVMMYARNTERDIMRYRVRDNVNVMGRSARESVFRVIGSRRRSRVREKELEKA